MEYYISETEDAQIQTQLPTGFDFAFKDENGKFVHSSELVSKWFNVDMNAICGELFNKTYDEFLSEKYSEMVTDPIYLARTIENVYKPIGQRVIANFLGRNRADGINHEQSSHTLGVGLKAMEYLNSGALSDAIDELNEITPDDFTETFHWITQARIDSIINDIETELGKI